MSAIKWRERLMGSSRRLGWWTLPAFLVVGLAGAVMAAALAVGYYGQQVSKLRAEIKDDRAALEGAVDEVRSAGQDALAAIEDQVEGVKESLDRVLPVEDTHELGVVVIRALVRSAPPQPGDESSQTPPPASEAQPQGAPDDADGDGPAVTAAQEEPAQLSDIVPRIGTGFPVANDGGTTYFATSYGLVIDEEARAGVVEFVEVVTPSGTVRGTVHSWDESRDLALVAASVGGLPIPAWRNSADPVATGERLTIAGVTPTLDSVQLNTTVGYQDVTLMVTDAPRVDFLRGAPIIDQDGLIVAVYTPDYLPFGSSAGEGQAVAPVGLLCERMLRACEELEAPVQEPSEAG